MKTLRGKDLWSGMTVTITHVPGFWGRILGKNKGLKGTPMKVVSIDFPFVVFETIERNESPGTDMMALITGGKMRQTKLCEVVRHRSIYDTRGFRFKELSDSFVEEAHRGCSSEIESGGEPSPFEGEKE